MLGDFVAAVKMGMKLAGARDEEEEDFQGWTEADDVPAGIPIPPGTEAELPL